MKNGSWPSGVTVAVPSHSTWMRPEKVSATTGPADLDSTTGCSPIGSAGKSPRFVPIPHGNKDVRNRRMPRTQVSRMMNLFEVAMDISRRLTRIFLRNEEGRRPVHGGTEKFQTDPHWRDYVLFYEY